MLPPSRIHHRKEDYFSKIRHWEFFIKNANVLLSALAKLGLFLGILIVFLYLWKIEFMPSGLSLTDGITFIFTFWAFIFFVIIGLIYGAACTYWLIFLIAKLFNNTSRLTKFAQSRKIAALSIFIFLLMVFLFWSRRINDNAVEFVFLLAELGLLSTVIVLSINDTEKNTATRYIYYVIAFLVLCTLLIFFSKGKVLSIAMISIGVRYENVSIETTAENIKSVKSLEKIFNIQVETCPLTGTDHQLIRKANILWTGIGNRTLIELVNPQKFIDSTPKKSLYVQFDSATLKPVYAQSLLESEDRVKVEPLDCQE